MVAELVREGIPQSLKQLAGMKEEIAHFRALSRRQKAKSSVRGAPKGLASKYLETEFGWKPLVSDLTKAAKAISDADRILEDLRRNSGKRMRRRYVFPTESSTTLYKSDNTQPWPGVVPYGVQQTGGRVINWRKTKRTWFSGEFVYTYPSEKRLLPLNVVAGANKILGVKLDAEVLWNLTPWSWLTDWFANTGDVVANISAIGNDNLVLRYGYLMQEATSVFDHTHHGVTIAGSGITNATIRGSFSESIKTRIGATPFGFGLTTGELDARQLAILASIGITRL
jgi:hypothetical protein